MASITIHQETKDELKEIIVTEMQEIVRTASSTKKAMYELSERKGVTFDFVVRKLIQQHKKSRRNPS